MKFKFLSIFLFVGQISFSQSSLSNIIDTSNYYDKCTYKGSMNWLRISDAVPIIIDELEKNGYSYAFINVGKLFQVDKGKYLVLTVSYDNEKNFGFIYKQGHGFPLYKSDRHFLTKEDTLEFQDVQNESINDTSTTYFKIKKLPKNTFILDEHCYWYEFDPNNEVKYPVSKEVINEILRQDIRAYLSRLKK
jgi:hypothetical protein